MTMREGTSAFRVWHDALATLEPELPLGEGLSLDEALLRGRSGQTLFTSVMLALGAATFLIAVVGLYGVHSFLMGCRIREIGIAGPWARRHGDSSVRTSGEGSGRCGLVSCSESVRAFDGAPLLAYLLPPALLVGTSVIAIWSPTRRAAGVDPVDALREG